MPSIADPRGVRTLVDDVALVKSAGMTLSPVAADAAAAGRAAGSEKDARKGASEDRRKGERGQREKGTKGASEDGSERGREKRIGKTRGRERRLAVSGAPETYGAERCEDCTLVDDEDAARALADQARRLDDLVRRLRHSHDPATHALECVRGWFVRVRVL